MWKTLILFISLCNYSIAQERFTQEARTQFIEEVKEAIAEGKFENGGVFSLELARADFYEQLEDEYFAKKLTRAEYDRIKENFNRLTQQGLKGNHAEKMFLVFVEQELKEVNAKSIPIQKENEICNELTCAKGLSCAADPHQASIGGRKKAGAICANDSECSSYQCVTDELDGGKKVCEDVYKCYQPLNLGQSCTLNPVCGAGLCLDYDSMTSGIGECSPIGKSCKTGSDCCSNSCQSGRCEANKVCKDCVGAGSRPQKLQKCCEGLYKNQKGICVPDVPPTVIIKVNNTKKNNILNNIANFIFSTAYADDAKKVSNEALKKEIKRDSVYQQDSFNQVSSNVEEFDSSKISKKFSFKKESDFKTCSIDLKNDFLTGLTKTKAIDLEMSLLAFDYVMSGEQIADYWRLNKTSPATSLNHRLKKASAKNLEHRKSMLESIEKSNKELTCMCLDVKGFLNIENEEQKEFFKTDCPTEYEKYAKAEVNSKGHYSDANLNGDASGVKGKTLIVIWTEKLQELHMGLAVEVFNSSDELKKISEWAQATNWGETRHIYDDLFKFHTKGNPSMAGMGAVAGAILAAGVVAILGGFSLSSFISVWAISGIIASSVTGATGMWMVSSLRGAWGSLRPEISDYVTAPQAYSCGKKATCTEYTRTLIQPYNSICDSHISANACVVKFATFQFSPEEEVRYLVDPFNPKGSPVTPGKGLYTGDLARDLDAGFLEARAFMISLSPKTTRGGGKVSESYLTEVFAGAKVVGKYNSKVMGNYKDTPLTAEQFDVIMTNAKTFAIEQQMIAEDDVDNLQVFAETALYYHYLWPKTTKSQEISYPAVGLQSYLSLMANDISANLSGYYANEVAVLNDLGIKYEEDRKNTASIYKAKTANAGATNSKYYEDIERMAQSGLDRKNAIAKNLVGENDTAAGSVIGQNAALTNLDNEFIKTVMGLRNLRQSQIEASNHYNQEMSSSGNMDRAQKMQAVARDFKKGFASGRSKISDNALSSLAKNSSTGMEAGKLTGSKFKKGASGIGSGTGGGSFFDSMGGAGSLGSNSSDANKKDEAGSARDYSASIGSFPGGFGGGSNYGRGSSSGYGQSGSGSSSGDRGNSGTMSQSALQDNQTLRDAIDARDKRGSSQYSSNEEATIFEQITNAYIRNYDKVLIIRKNRDTIEDSE